jgi:FkbM family methyltransferase
MIFLEEGWRKGIRDRIVRQGIKAVCGARDDVSTDAAADISLLSGGLRFAFVRTLGALGVENFVARSGLGYHFLCHTGDLAEYPFYHRRAFEKELAILVAWLEQAERPVVYDLGANVGFLATHLAQMLASHSPTIYAFEPAPETYRRLVQSVERLGLGDFIRPIAAAASDAPGTLRLLVSKGNSLETQVVSQAFDNSPADSIAFAPAIALDQFSISSDAHPDLIKMDVEGSEVAALRGATRLLSRSDRPAILFEHNPTSLAQRGADLGALYRLLSDYVVYYIDDLRGQLLPFGSPVESVEGVDWICNIFAAPRGEVAAARWSEALRRARHSLERRERRSS